MNPSVYRIAVAVMAVLLLMLELRVDTLAVPGGGDAFASAAGGRQMAVAAAENADALAELLAGALLGDEP